MIRLALWIISSLAVTALIAWLISLPGTMTIEVAGFIAQPRLGLAIAVLLGLVVLIIAVWAIIRRILMMPRFFARRGRDRRRERGITALSDAVIALHAGEPGLARDLAREARQHLSANAAAQLLEARAHLALGDTAAAREHYRALIGNPRTAMAALSGLHEQARAQGRHAAALTFARKAASLQPNTAWAADAVFDDLVRKGAWAEAIAMTASAPVAGREARAKKKHRQAVLETAFARELEPTDPSAALAHALAALKLQPDFVPAALIAARIVANRGEVRRAMNLLRRVYRSTRHPDVATLYANSQPGASAVDRLKRVRELIDTPPSDRASAIVLARAAIDAYEWKTARAALDDFVANEPTQGVAMLMAEIEEGQNADQGKAREWLGRAVRAPRDPTWTADGITSGEWEPTSPITGRLDAFEWKVPVSASTSRLGDQATTEGTAAAPSRPLPAPQP
ncbi:MAG TPA: heme biosynthesis HemY N-terminal domain-containing protein [Devosiaceae bacterium]|nr:heme biosynthesis HemY N-terminal domain-containing protein [Devosiaceae bacterium]